jgi:hypothetical protein
VHPRSAPAPTRCNCALQPAPAPPPAPPPPPAGCPCCRHTRRRLGWEGEGAERRGWQRGLRQRQSPCSWSRPPYMGESSKRSSIRAAAAAGSGIPSKLPRPARRRSHAPAEISKLAPLRLSAAAPEAAPPALQPPSVQVAAPQRASPLDCATATAAAPPSRARCWMAAANVPQHATRTAPHTRYAIEGSGTTLWASPQPCWPRPHEAPAPRASQRPPPAAGPLSSLPGRAAAPSPPLAQPPWRQLPCSSEKESARAGGRACSGAAPPLRALPCGRPGGRGEALSGLYPCVFDQRIPDAVGRVLGSVPPALPCMLRVRVPWTRLYAMIVIAEVKNGIL